MEAMKKLAAELSKKSLPPGASEIGNEAPTKKNKKSKKDDTKTTKDNAAPAAARKKDVSCDVRHVASEKTFRAIVHTFPPLKHQLYTYTTKRTMGKAEESAKKFVRDKLASLSANIPEKYM